MNAHVLGLAGDGPLDSLLAFHRRVERQLAERKRFRLLRTQLQGEHRPIEAAWRRLRRPLEAVAEGFERRLDVDAIQSFRALCAVHIGFQAARARKGRRRGVRMRASGRRKGT